MRRSLHSLVLLAPVAACEVPDPPAVETADSTLATVPTELHHGFQPALFGKIDARFAIDDAGAVVGAEVYDVDSGAWVYEAPTASLLLADDTYAGSETPENSCRLTWSLDGVAPSPDAEALGAWLLLELPSDPAPTSTCGGLDFPPSWEGDVVAQVQRWIWTVGVGPLDPGTRADIEADWGADFATFEPYLAGGGWGWDGLQLGEFDGQPYHDGWVPTSATFAYALDDAMRQEESGGVPVLLEAELLPVDGGLARAWYEVNGLTMVGPAKVLVE